MRLRRILSAVFLILVQLAATETVYANSAPVYTEGYPAAEIMTVDRDCPIRIDSEKLTFDLSDNKVYAGTIQGEVKASYDMVNPTDREMSVRMVFPLVSSYHDLFRNDILVEADGMKLDYEIYTGDTPDNYGKPSDGGSGTDFSLDKILETISEKTYRAVNFSGTETGKLYRINVEPINEERINFAVSFSLDSNKSKVLTKGFNRFERNGTEIRTAASCYGPETLEIFVLGEDIDFDITVYTDGELIRQTQNYSYDIKTETVGLKSYILSFAEEFWNELTGTEDKEEAKDHQLSDDLIFNTYARALDRAFSANDGFSFCEDIWSCVYNPGIFALVYDVDFPAGSHKIVTVSYTTDATMDRRQTQEPLYTFSYIINPARYWAGFGTLDIEIITSERAPYIVDSSIELTNEGDRLYRAHLDSLPRQDLFFSVYKKEKITLSDRAFANPYVSFDLLIVFVVIVFAAISAVYLIKRLKVKKLRRKL